MAKCLMVDTTASQLLVVLSNEGIAFSSVNEVGKVGHSKLLLPAIDDVLKKASVDISEVDTVAVVVGPGSFTGIRIGVSLMTAIAFCNNAKRIMVNAFEIIAYNQKNIIASVEAGHSNLYIANCDNGKVLSTSFLTADEVSKIDTSAYIKTPLKDSASTLFEIVSKKIDNNEYTKVLEPFYMRKSQAERQKDEV